MALTNGVIAQAWLDMDGDAIAQARGLDAAFEELCTMVLPVPESAVKQAVWASLLEFREQLSGPRANMNGKSTTFSPNIRFS